MLIYGISQSKTMIPTCKVMFRNITVTRGDHRFNVTPEDYRLFLPSFMITKDVLFSKTSSIYEDFFCLNDYEKLESCFRK